MSIQDGKPFLADLTTAANLVRSGHLIGSSSMPHSHQYAWINRVTDGVTKRWAVCGIGYKHSMKQDHPDAEVIQAPPGACKYCGK